MRLYGPSTKRRIAENDAHFLCPTVWVADRVFAKKPGLPVAVKNHVDDCQIIRLVVAVNAEDAVDDVVVFGAGVHYSSQEVPCSHGRISDLIGRADTSHRHHRLYKGDRCEVLTKGLLENGGNE